MGGGISILKKGDFRADSLTFPEFLQSRGHMSVLSLNTSRYLE